MLLPPEFASDVPALFFGCRKLRYCYERIPGAPMRIVILSGALLLLAALALHSRRRNVRERRRTSSATERWEDEGGALRGRPG